MTTDKKEEAIQRLAALILAEVQPWGGTGLIAASQRAARIAVEQGVEKAWDASSSREYPLPWDAVYWTASQRLSATHPMGCVGAWYAYENGRCKNCGKREAKR